MIDRLRFLQLSGAAAVTCRTHLARTASITDRSFEHGRPLREFHYSQVVFAPGLHQPSVTRAQFVTAPQPARNGAEWQVKTSSGTRHLVPFSKIETKRYSLYLFI
jgi:hypothetical protein